MIILSDSDNRKNIKLSISDVIHEGSPEIGKKEYTIVLPLVVCNDKKDAEYIQSQVNMYVNEICKEVLEK